MRSAKRMEVVAINRIVAERESAAAGHPSALDTPLTALSPLTGWVGFAIFGVDDGPMFVPAELTQRPFTLPEARLHGLTEDKLRGASWRRLYRGVYAWHAIADEPLVRLRAVLCRVPEGAVFCGLTAAWLHGLDVSPFDPIEIAVTSVSNVTRRAGLRLHRSTRLETSWPEVSP